MFWSKHIYCLVMKHVQVLIFYVGSTCNGVGKQTLTLQVQKARYYSSVKFFVDWDNIAHIMKEFVNLFQFLLGFLQKLTASIWVHVTHYVLPTKNASQIKTNTYPCSSICISLLTNQLYQVYRIWCWCGKYILKVGVYLNFVYNFTLHITAIHIRQFTADFFCGKSLKKQGNEHSIHFSSIQTLFQNQKAPL